MLSMVKRGKNNNIINYNYIDYIIKTYVPELVEDPKHEKVNMHIFRQAMQHSSTKKSPEDKTYERLEFLGDSIFHLVLTEYLYNRYDEENEGFLTRLRIRLERGDSMAELTQILEIDEYLQIHGAQINDSIMEDIFEAFIGAFYLNFGMAYTKIFIIHMIEMHKDLSELINNDDNYKDLLLRYYHQMKWGHPIYEFEIVDQNYISYVKDNKKKVIGIGKDFSKKKSEQKASKNALEKLKVIVNGEVDSKWLEKVKDIMGPKEKEEKEIKKTISIFNPSNELLSKDIIKTLFENYNVVYSDKIKTINLKVFNEAMTHKSYLRRKNLTDEDKKAEKGCVKLQPRSNERLQFLGDAIIHFIIGEYLYNKYPNEEEGFLTRLRCKLENQEFLFELSKRSEICEFVLISQAIEVIHGRENISIISGGFEAFFGALFLEMGLKICKYLFVSILNKEMDIDELCDRITNYKELILQLYNKKHWGVPEYKVIKEEGPDHMKTFNVGLYFNNKCIGKGTGSSKKKAEQIAAQKAYTHLLEFNR